MASAISTLINFSAAKLAYLVVVLGASGCTTLPRAMVARLENNLLYQPSSQLDYDRAPADLDYEEVWITPKSGPAIHAWYCPAEQPRAIVLFAHGNAGNLADRAQLVHTWVNHLGVTVLAFDYRGYGKSEGHPSEKGLVDDARAAREWLARRAGVSEKDVVLLGRSLGGAVMVELAASDGARGLVVESSFTSLPELARWKLPLNGVDRLLTTQFLSVQRIPEYQGPVLIAHGAEDMVVPSEHGRKLFEAANDPKQLVIMPEAKHNWHPPPDYLMTLSRFIDGLPTRRTQ